ncbi:sn-glycerol-3-phosphate ABC transporter permease [Bordetella pertussis]|nr:sn-glycerol-3-phosphate ABC transporter permease [Bordetella pertussis]
MVERRPWLDILAHFILLCGVALVAFPIYVTFVASTQTAQEVASAPMSLIPGKHFVDNYMQALFAVRAAARTARRWPHDVCKPDHGAAISLGKIAISLLSAFAVVYFRFPGRMFFFWMIFVTLMLPVEVRIAPTYKVVADLGLLNSYAGLTLPLIASATATFLFRQFF